MPQEPTGQDTPGWNFMSVNPRSDEGSLASDKSMGVSMQGLGSS